jgi:hypothetical protein
MDMITYLTYVENNLTKEKLPVLYGILEDQELTDAIGWDLIKTLLPLLPESQECLIRIATTGNAKEVILRAAESLRHIEFDTESDGEEESEEKTQSNHQSNGHDEQLPLPLLQVQILLHMLALLHRRLKVKYPSRFLSSTLQAILATYPNINSHLDEISSDLVNFIKTLVGAKRPLLPPRRSSSTIARISMLSMGANGNHLPPPAVAEEKTEEDLIQAQLLKSFLTHVLDDSMSSISSAEAIPGLAWGTRFMEHIKHPMLVTQKISLTEQFAHSESLENRLTTVGQAVALAMDLEIHSDDLFKAFMDPKNEDEGDRDEEANYPTSAADIPLSKAGSLYLFTARKAMEMINDGPKMATLQIFPDHNKLLKNFCDEAGSEVTAMGPDSLLDALLFHGLIAIEANQIGNPESDTQFYEYLQLTSALSATLPNSMLRFQAHFITTTILRSHPRELVQIEFIKDTLENCPFENLKVSAVSWVKGLTLDAAMSIKKGEPTESLFATPAPLNTFSHSLFPDLTLEYPNNLGGGDITEYWTLYQMDYSFYMASLNFLYLLLHSSFLHEPLQLKRILEDNEVHADFVGHLRSTVKWFLAKMEAGGPLHDVAQEDPAVLPQQEVVLMWCDNVDGEAKKLGWW